MAREAPGGAPAPPDPPFVFIFCFLIDVLRNSVKSNKNNTLETISNTLNTVVDKNDYKLEFKYGLFLSKIIFAPISN